MGSVTRADLTDAAYGAAPGTTRAEAKALVDAVFDEISAALVAGETVKIHEFCVFETRRKRARWGRNPKRPQEPALIPPHTAVRFRASGELRAAVADVGKRRGSK